MSIMWKVSHGYFYPYDEKQHFCTHPSQVSASYDTLNMNCFKLSDFESTWNNLTRLHQQQFVRVDRVETAH